MKRSITVVASAISVALLSAACLPAPATSQARDLDDLWRIFIVAGIVVAAIVWVLVTWTLIRHRRRDDRLPVQIAGHLGIEAVWTAIPLLTVLVLFGLTMRTLGAVDLAGPGDPAAPSGGAAASDPAQVQLDVTAFRWAWQVTYRSSGLTLTGTTGQALEVVLPVDTDIHITLASRDVNHAFFVPAFLFKRDAIPGRTSRFDIQIAAPGTYPGACAEYCGVFHDQMPFAIRAVSAAEFADWLAAGGGGPGATAPAAASTPAASSSPSVAP